MNHAIVGELTYVDGCEDGSTKGGSFVMWKPGHRETVIAP